jgi:hypothetical protein
LDEPFVGKEYHTALIIGHRVVQLQHSDRQINQGGTQSGRQPFSVRSSERISVWRSSPATLTGLVAQRDTFQDGAIHSEQAKLDVREGGFALLKRQNLFRCQTTAF